MKSFKSLTPTGQARRLSLLAQEALRGYALPGIKLTLLSHGHNTLFRVDSADGIRYALRVQRPGWGTVESVRSELLWLSALQRETDLDPAGVISTAAGDLLQVAAVECVPEPRICVLFDWINGRSLNTGLMPGHLRRVGTLMAQMQAHAANYTLPNGFVRGRIYSLTNEANKASRSGEPLFRGPSRNLRDEQAAVQLVADICSSQDGALIARALDCIHAVQSTLGFGPDVYGLIHADLHQWNVRFRQGRVCALDFDDCGWGHRLYDMAVTLSEIQRRENAPALRAAFMAGYRSVLPLPKEHEEYLDAFITMRNLQNMVWWLETRDFPERRTNWKRVVQSILEDVRQWMR
jgi:Ser/Thr protein kinase RdoA (MazF antagonist)